MKSVLDIFLQEQGLTRYELAKVTGLSEATLSKANTRNPETYAVKTVALIAEGVNLSPGEVLNRLLAIQKEATCLYTVATLSELKQRVKKQEDEFYVVNDFHELLKEVKRESLSENENLGFLLGSRGMGSIDRWLITRFFHLFIPPSERNRENLKQEISTLYTIQLLDSQTAKLRLKSLDD